MWSTWNLNGGTWMLLTFKWYRYKRTNSLPYFLSYNFWFKANIYLSTNAHKNLLREKSIPNRKKKIFIFKHLCRNYFATCHHHSQYNTIQINQAENHDAVLLVYFTYSSNRTIMIKKFWIIMTSPTHIIEYIIIKCHNAIQSMQWFYCIATYGIQTWESSFP